MLRAVAGVAAAAASSARSLVEVEGGRRGWTVEALRCRGVAEEGSSAASPPCEDCCSKKAAKTLPADCIVGSSRLAGVAVFDLERRVDLPKAPVSGTPRRARTFVGLPSCLEGTLSADGVFETVRKQSFNRHTVAISLHMVSGRRPRLCTAPRRGHCVG